MRISKKHSILKMIDTCYQAHTEIKKNIELKNSISAEEILGLCQEGAISIGTAIETSEGERFITIPYIEEYCESIYDIYHMLDMEQVPDANEAYERLNKQLSDIENSIKEDVPVKLEMVFLPYKVSMWDSLESVWRAAYDDPDCDAYVIPIPYYDKNPDGSFRNEYYEGEEFPKDVPITHYNDYDFIGRHPDVVFIHNPYDHGNYVTSVHPFFYSAKIKEYCDKLVYIPYYSSAEVNPDSEEVMRAKAGFVLTYGVLNSDLVIVQSENTKKLFVNILSREVPGTNRDYWEQRILGLGSPKLDRVKSVQRDDTKLPEKWKKIIYTETGLRKKVILYNISVHDLLNHYDMLDKIKDVLEFFKENTDVALWWRPHPLYESTLASIRPDKLEEYRGIVHKYKEEAWGIFDEGVDLEWAIAETDAYYGDGSSVVQLYQEVQKPVMYQKVSVRANEEIKAEDIPIWPSAFCVDGDDIWFVHGKMSILMRYKVKEDDTCVVARVPSNCFFKENAYQGIYKWKNQVFIIPAWEREIAVYDILEDTFQIIVLNNIINYQQKLLFCKTYKFEKFLYCIPYTYESILKINMDTLEIKYINIQEKFDKKSKFSILDATRVGKEEIAIITDVNKIILFDTRTDTFEIQLMGNAREYMCLTSIEEKIYLYDRKEKKIMEWDKRFSKKEKMFLLTLYDDTILHNLNMKYMLVDSNSDSDFMIVNKDGKITYRNNINKNIDRKELDYSYHHGIVNEVTLSDEIYYFSNTLNMLYLIEDGKIKYQRILSLTEQNLNRLKEMWGYKIEKIFVENELNNVRSWINLIKTTESNISEKESEFGKHILNAIKEKVFKDNKD